MWKLMLHFEAVFISVLVLRFVSVNTQGTVCNGTLGRNFHLGVLESFDHDEMKIDIVVTGSSDGHVTIRAPSVGMDSTYSLANHTVTVRLPSSLVQLQNNSVEDKAVRVSATVDVSVELITYEYFTNEQVQVLPTSCLSTRYILSNYVPYIKYPDFKSNFLVVATQDDTLVNVGFRASNSSVRMDGMQSYLFTSVDDTTGAIVTSDKPVAVFSGHEMLITSEMGGAYVAEQLLPTELYGSSYIVPALYPKSRYLIRTISSESDTLVTYRNNSDTTNRKFLMNASGDFKEIYSDEPLVVNASKPVTVMQYSLGYEDQGDNLGDPFLSIVPATTQYLSEYIFTVPEAFGKFTNYLSLIAPYDVVNGIQLDGQSLPAVSKAFNITNNGSIYSVNTYTVGTGFHRLNQMNQATFGAMIYGYLHKYGYGSYLGLDLKPEKHPSSIPAGTWSPWYEGDCSVTVGQGVATRIRQCSSGHNEDCVGNFSESVTCMPKPCAASVPTTTPPPVLHCLSAPCQHGGECEDLPGTFNCFCSGGYYGSMCDEDYDECLYRRPCKNGGTCVNTVGSYMCTCPSGFVGPNCQG